jgi:hypothetical protein
LYFIGEEFEYEPKGWMNLPYVQELAKKIVGKNGLAKQYNDEYEHEMKGEDPEYVIPTRPYENILPEPDFLISGGRLFEVFGGTSNQERYDVKMSCKKKLFSSLGDKFVHINQEPLGIAYRKQSLMSYANVLDTKVCNCPDNTCCDNGLFQTSVMERMESIAPLLNALNISVLISYKQQLEEWSKIEGEIGSKQWEWGDVQEYSKMPEGAQEFEKQKRERIERGEDLYSSTFSWYKVSQQSGIYGRTDPVTMQQIIQGLKQEGFWTPHLWSDNDKIAMYFKTPENLQIALSKMGNQPMQFPQQEQQVAAFNLSRFRKQ